MYICSSDREEIFMQPFGYLFLEIKWLCHDSIYFYTFFRFHLEVTCYLHALHLCYRGNWRHPRKPLLYDLVFKEKQLRCEFFSYLVFIIFRGTAMSRSHLITLCYSHFSLDIYLFENISLRINFKWVYSVGERWCYYMRFLTYMCDQF